MEKQRNRIVGLDILRTTAILLVVYLHGRLLLPDYLQKNYFKFVFIDGVSVFFVLSGFLIGGILLRIINETEFRKVDLINFWIRRWFRTIPNYLIILVGLVLFRIFIFKNLSEPLYLYFFFLQNFAQPQPDFFPEAWSLSIEEWFYFLFPLCCYLFHRLLQKKTTSVLYSAILFLLIPLVLRIIKFELGVGVDDFEEEYRKITILRLDSLMYGIIAACVYFFREDLWLKSKHIALCLGISLIIIMHLNTYYQWMVIYPPFFLNIESISVLLVLPFFSELKTTKIKYLDFFFFFVSTISYSMYLLNLTPVMHHLIPFTNSMIGYKNVPMEKIFVHNYILYWIYTLIGATLLYSFYEKRMTKLRDTIKL